MANKADRDINRMLQATKMADRRNFRNMVSENYYYSFAIALLILATIWYFAAHLIDQPFIVPYLESVIAEVIAALYDLHVWRSFGITMRRVITGVVYGAIFGYPLGMLMGYSP